MWVQNTSRSLGRESCDVVRLYYYHQEMARIQASDFPEMSNDHNNIRSYA